MEQLEALKIKIPYDIDIFLTQVNYELVLNDLLNDTKYICLSRIYPYEDYSLLDIPNKYLNFQLRACVELYNLADKVGILSYSENGLNWSRLSDGLSNHLMSELIPSVGVPKKVVVEDV